MVSEIGVMQFEIDFVILLILIELVLSTNFNCGCIFLEAHFLGAFTKNVSLENHIEFQFGENIGKGTIWIVIVTGFLDLVNELKMKNPIPH